MSNRKISIICILLYVFFFEILTRLIDYLKIGLIYGLIVNLIMTILWAVVTYLFLKKYLIDNRPDLFDGEISYHNIEEIQDKDVQYAVVVAKFNDKWIFIRHKEGGAWEIPNGKRETYEEIFKTAERMLIEKTGAKAFAISPLYIYAVNRNSGVTYGLLCYSEIVEFGDTLGMEAIEVKEFDEIPDDLTYPLIQPELFRKVKENAEEIRIKSKSFT